MIYIVWYTQLLLLSLLPWGRYANAASETSLLLQRLQRLQRAYPQHIRQVSESAIVWHDGTVFTLEPYNSQKTITISITEPTMTDQIMQEEYTPGMPHLVQQYIPSTDSGRVRYEPFFRKMYGTTPEEVQQTVEAVAWLPKLFGVGTYTLFVTRINGIAAKLRAISAELEEAAQRNAALIPFLEKPGLGYYWRTIAHTNRLSSHSFGMSIDINPLLTQYWQYDIPPGNPITENHLMAYRNTVPYEIVLIFEKYGFIWGGKWQHYDTMHFEYRPELFPESALT